MLEFFGVKAHAGGSADEPFNSEIGATAGVPSLLGSAGGNGTATYPPTLAMKHLERDEKTRIWWARQQPQTRNIIKSW